MCPSRDILGTLQVGTGWGPDALGELQWKTVPSRLPHKTPQMGQLVNDKHDFSALWHPASPGSAVWRSSSCPLLVPLTAPSPGRRDVGFLWVLIALLRAPPHALSTHLFSIAFGGGVPTSESQRHTDIRQWHGGEAPPRLEVMKADCFTCGGCPHRGSALSGSFWKSSCNQPKFIPVEIQLSH